MKSVLPNNIDKIKDPSLPFFKVLKEYIIFKQLEMQFPHASIRVYGLCFRDNSYSFEPTGHSQLNHGVHLIVELGRSVSPHCGMFHKFQEMNDRLVNFKAGPIALTDVKPEQFVVTEHGVHVSDIDDALIKDTNAKEEVRHGNMEKIKSRVFHNKNCKGLN